MDLSFYNSLYLGETLGFWIQTGAIILSAAFAFFMWKHQAKQSKRRATIDVILNEKGNKELNDAKKRIYELINGTKTFIDAYKEGADDKEKILLVLNQKEFIAKGIHCKAFEEEIYKDTQYSNNMKIWKATKPLIMEIRRIENRDTLFQEFECLSVRWEKRPLKKIS